VGSCPHEPDGTDQSPRRPPGPRVRGTRLRLSVLAIALVLLIPAAASASLAGEQTQGQTLIGQLHAGTKTCSGLSAGDLDHIGEYVMFQALGSTTVHQAMNDRMRAMLGEQGETRMYQLLGTRYAGCSTRTGGIAGSTGMMGSSGMMGGYAANGGISAMMTSGDWSWMMGSAWQHMTRQDWQRHQHQLLGLRRPHHDEQRIERDRDHRRLPRSRHPRRPRLPRDHPPSIQTATDRRPHALATLHIAILTSLTGQPIGR
jgi:hypothetical protein